ncbi:hypothetical protein [Vibrio sp. CAU 1672]|uniref:hypothetical protein n=1 Tax=Vibrio sp. CAU 1672 TaxID=3032594 RepID=UPI0023DC8F58|nr:hypothetical protein [Vibrio sp. CAU 1672]MDF2153376.1 hypothetical protein [Vibrio sp. CAU 1672]
MGIQAKSINTILVSLLVISLFGIAAFYFSYTDQANRINILQGQLIEKENQLLIANEALSYTRYQHQLMVEDYIRYRGEDRMQLTTITTE